MGSYNMAKAGVDLPPVTAMVLSTFAGISLYNVLELILLIFWTFNRRHGLYFWSFTTSTVAIIPYTVGLMLKFFNIGPPDMNMFLVTLIIFGWCFMVTGQSVILYSRLHLVVRNSRWTNFVLSMIIANFCISNIPIAVLVYGANSNNPAPFRKPYGVWERLQLSLYFVQELITSCIYVFEMMRMLRHGSDQRRVESSRAIMRQLLYVNILIIIIDITLLITEFVGHYEIQVLYKGIVYSIKLKLECKALHQLKKIAQRGQSTNTKAGSYDTTWVTGFDNDHDQIPVTPKMAIVTPAVSGQSTPGSLTRVPSKLHFRATGDEV